MVVAIVPIILTVGLGFLVESVRKTEVRAISTIAIYVLLPSLIFTSLLTTKVTLGEAVPLIGVVLILTALLWVLGKAIARARHYSADDESLLMLTTLFMNAGNMGMPVAFYAFGDRGLDLAVIWVLVVNALSSTVAVYYLSRHLGGSGRALRAVFTLPSLYAAAAALVLRSLGISLPTFLFDPLQLLGRAVIPVSQLVLGIQLAKARSQVSLHMSQALLPNFIRLLLSPAIAFALVNLLGVHGLAAKVAILLAAMPTAVNMAIFATEFDAQPRRVATAVFTSTLASFITLSALLWLLG